MPLLNSDVWVICPKVLRAMAVASTGTMSTPVPRYCVFLPSFYEWSLQLVLPNVDLHSREESTQGRVNDNCCS